MCSGKVSGQSQGGPGGGDRPSQGPVQAPGPEGAAPQGHPAYGPPGGGEEGRGLDWIGLDWMSGGGGVFRLGRV
ncbi:hypothetical protein A3770_14p72260 [Chloropicon primus]|uniref:Uncharacterized protein n=1 Tax=Chloropicon primus TaxID=1764295 RepID=A0A5B8MV89_9CHLO|nr:hypothetical protein A3770_14p72260 [Chloropicon primus]|eukprot:QDZ24708.1 hypothetical protein A3770_14p72260 [Chloropicon primus]